MSSLVVTRKPTELPKPSPTQVIPTVKPEPTPEMSPSPTATLVPTKEPTPTPVEEAGNGAQPTEQPDTSEGSEETGQRAALRAEIEQKIADGVYQELDNTKYDWWFIRKKEHMPSGSGEEFNISQYDGFYRNKNVDDVDKVIYLTFDCGYENGFTPTLLDILAKHNAPAMFFVTKSFINTCPDYVTRMKEEGYLVGNHTLNHPVMPTVDETTLMNEILGCAELFYETTGYEMDPFLRPPTGAYSERTLALTKDLGYSTIFWSIAYHDYDPNDQPGKEYVLDHFTTYYHNGAIPLIHNISQSNTEALDDVLTMLEEAGYRFGSLAELKSVETQ